MAPYCPECGTEVDKEMAKCPECGEWLDGRKTIYNKELFDENVEYDSGKALEEKVQVFCDFLAEIGLRLAKRQTQLFFECLSYEYDSEHLSEDWVSIFKVFSFLNWGYINGVWSGLPDEKLRQNLMEESLVSISKISACEIVGGEVIEDIAFNATQLYFEYKEVIPRFVKSLNEIEQQTNEASALSVLFFGMLWIQNLLGIPEDKMREIRNVFSSNSNQINELEGAAFQLNRTFPQKRKRGLLGKIFGI